MSAGERLVTVGEVELALEEFGDPAGTPLLMIMGLGAQMIYWPNGLCELLAARGFRVIRFDNRDAGHSTKLDSAGAPSLQRVLGGDLGGVPYTLSDMAADAAGLLDSLGIDSAHVAGASQGGMIAQTLAIEHPQRVASLASIMSTTGDRSVGQASQEAIEVLMARPPTDLDGYVEAFLAARRVIGSPGFPRDEETTSDLARRAYERGFFPDGTMRQLVAIIASGDRTAALRGLDVPTVVIHGEDDPLVDISGGRATAAAIPGARLVTVPGMGHDLPEGTWATIAEEITANAERAKAPAR